MIGKRRQLDPVVSLGVLRSLEILALQGIARSRLTGHEKSVRYGTNPIRGKRAEAAILAAEPWTCTEQCGTQIGREGRKSPGSERNESERNKSPQSPKPQVAGSIPVPPAPETRNRSGFERNSLRPLLRFHPLLRQ